MKMFSFLVAYLYRMNPNQSNNNPYARINFDGRARATGQTLAEHIEEEEFIARLLAEAATAQQTQENSIAQGAGGGGSPPRAFFQVVPGPTFTVANGIAPIFLSVNNTSPVEQLQFCNWSWNFGAGTTSTSAVPDAHFYNTGSFVLSATASRIYDGIVATYSAGFTASKEAVTASFTSSTVTGPAPLTIAFVNTSVNSSQTPSNTWLWLFGTGSLTGTGSAVGSSSLANPSWTFMQTGSYTITLQQTGSYQVQTSSVKIAYISASVT